MTTTMVQSGPAYPLEQLMQEHAKHEKWIKDIKEMVSSEVDNIESPEAFIPSLQKEI